MTDSRMVGRYFHLPLEGRGSLEIENLYGYTTRLAIQHGVSVAQLVRHIEGSIGFRESPGSRAFQTTFFGAGRPLCGIGRNVQLAIYLLEEATGESDLSAATFVDLKGVVSQHSSLLKPNRTWCSACYLQAQNTSCVIYERLYWLSKFCKRCVIHNIALDGRCPNCGAVQRGQRIKCALDICGQCQSTLVHGPKEWKRAERPCYGEREILEIIGFISDRHTGRLAARAFNTFLDELHPSFRIHQANLQLTSGKSREYTLDTVVCEAQRFGVSPLLIFLDPILAAKTASIQPWMVEPPRRNRIARSKSTKTRLAADLRLERWKTERGSGCRSLDEVCREHEVSTGYARYHFATLCSRLVAARRRRKLRDAITTSALIREYLQSELYPKYQDGSIASHDELVENIVSHCVVRIHVARKELSWFLSDQLGRP